MSPHLPLLLAYATALVGLGLWIGRRVDSSDSFFVAGRKLGPLMLFATILAANIGAGSTVGAAGLGYRDGISAWWWVGSAGLGTLALAWWLGPRIWRIAIAHDLQTVGDYLEHRYGGSVRVIVAGLLWLGTLAILAGQLIALAWVLDVVAGVPKVWGCLIGGAIVALYFAAGGLLTSAWVNLVQLVVLLVGFSVALVWALSDLGGLEAVRAAAPPGQPDYGSLRGFWGHGSSGWHYLALLGPAFIISPGLIQKAYGARDERTIRLGVGAAGLALLVFAVIPPLMGMMARVIDPQLANPELALPTLLTLGLPPLIGSIGLAAVVSAEMSSADAILFMLSTSLAKDFYLRFFRRDASDQAVLRFSRLAALAAAALGVALAIALPSVISSLSVFYSLLSVSLFVPIVAGLHSRRVGVPEALAAIGAGVMALLGARLAGITVPGSIWSPTTYGLLASALACGAVALARSRRQT